MQETLLQPESVGQVALLTLTLLPVHSHESEGQHNFLCNSIAALQVGWE